MNTCSECWNTNHRDFIFVRDAAQMLKGRGEYDDAITSASECLTQIFACGGRTGTERRVLVVNEQVGGHRLTEERISLRLLSLSGAYHRRVLQQPRTPKHPPVVAFPGPVIG